MMSNKVYEGRVYFKSDEGTHLQEFSSKDDKNKSKGIVS